MSSCNGAGKTGTASKVGQIVRGCPQPSGMCGPEVRLGCPSPFGPLLEARAFGGEKVSFSNLTTQNKCFLFFEFVFCFLQFILRQENFYKFTKDGTCVTSAHDRNPFWNALGHSLSSCPMSVTPRPCPASHAFGASFGDEI